jgi:hypothetical protein
MEIDLATQWVDPGSVLIRSSMMGSNQTERLRQFMAAVLLPRPRERDAARWMAAQINSQLENSRREGLLSPGGIV